MTPRTPAPMAESIRLVVSEGIARVTLARPEARNAFNAETIEQLHDVFSRITAADDVRAVVLAGEGKVFCGGADISWMRESLELSFDANVADAERMSDMFRTIDNCPKPVIGANPRRRARRRRRPCGRLRHRHRGRRRDLRIHRGQARHHSGGDLSVRSREDRRIACASALSDGRTLRRASEPNTSVSCTRSSPRSSSAPRSSIAWRNSSPRAPPPCAPRNC